MLICMVLINDYFWMHWFSHKFIIIIIIFLNFTLNSNDEYTCATLPVMIIYSELLTFLVDNYLFKYICHNYLFLIDLVEFKIAIYINII